MHVKAHTAKARQEYAVWVKIVITIGCVVSALLAVWLPTYTVHATVIGLATNIVWCWS